MNNSSPGPRIFATVLRYVVGLPLIVFGLNAFLNFFPKPATPLAPAAEAFSAALMNSGYMMQLIGITQLVVGVLLVFNRFVPLALVLFAPFIVNSVAFHLFLEHKGLPMAGISLCFELYLAWVYRAAYQPLFVARFSPHAKPTP
jgi:hypothetical protein